MNPFLNEFIKDLVSKFDKEIVSIIEFGSKRGEKNLYLSDIDVLILCRHHDKIGEIMEVARYYEKQIFKIVHSNVNNFIEKYFLGTNDPGGVHAVIISKDEFARNFKPKSLRLKILTFFISRPIFLYRLKSESNLLWGDDIVHDLKIPRLRLSDRLRAFSLPIVVLIFSPLAVFNREKFVVWCCKAVKYYCDYVEVFDRLTRATSPHLNGMIVENKAVVEIAKKFRYKPKDYPHNRLGLYFTVWSFFIGNIFKIK